MSLSLQNEQSYSLWAGLLENLKEIYNRLRLKPEDVKNKFRNYMIRTLTPNLNRLGWNRRSNDTLDDLQTRPFILSSTSYFGDKGVIEEANRRYQNNQVPLEFETLVFDTLVRYDNDGSNFLRLLTRYERSTNEREKTNLLQALTLSNKENQIMQVLNIVLSNNVRAQDGSAFINYMLLNNLNSVEIAWRWFKTNYNLILNKFGQAILDSRIVPAITQQFESKEIHDEVREFFRDRTDSPYIPIALANILRREKYIQTIYDDLVRYFN